MSIEALGAQPTFEAGLRVLRPSGTLSGLGVYPTDLRIALGAFAPASATTRSSSRSALAARSGWVA